MAVNLEGLVAVLGNAEEAAAAAVNGLGGTSSAADLTRAGFRVSQYTVVGAAVAQLIKGDGEAKLTAARAISRN
jgi:hypothetical protein